AHHDELCVAARADDRLAGRRLDEYALDERRLLARYRIHGLPQKRLRLLAVPLDVHRRDERRPCPPPPPPAHPRTHGPFPRAPAPPGGPLRPAGTGAPPSPPSTRPPRSRSRIERTSDSRWHAEWRRP